MEAVEAVVTFAAETAVDRKEDCLQNLPGVCSK